MCGTFFCSKKLMRCVTLETWIGDRADVHRRTATHTLDENIYGECKKESEGSHLYCARPCTSLSQTIAYVDQPTTFGISKSAGVYV